MTRTTDQPVPAPCGCADGGAARVDVTAPVTADVIADLCARVPQLLSAGASEVVLCDARGPVPADLSTVNAIARLQLAARRLGGEVLVCAQRADLRSLLALAGLGDIVRGCSPAPGTTAPDTTGAAGRVTGGPDVRPG